MTYLRYPDRPHISTEGRDITIEYNGIRLYFRVSSRGNSIYTGMHGIDKDLEGRIYAQELAYTEDDDREIRRERNMAFPSQRNDVLRMVLSYTSWFTDDTLARLEELLDTYKNEQSRTASKKPVTLPPGRNPNHSYLEKQRKQFCDVWGLVFAKNISPAQAARRLGYDPDDFPDE